MNKKIEIPDLGNKYKFASYASKYTVDDLLDIFNMVKGDKDKEESVKEILRMKTQKEYKNNVGNINLDSILLDFWEKDYGFIRDLRKVGVKEDKLEYTFLKGLHRDITKLLKGESISDGVIDKIFNYYNIDIYDRQLLSMLKNELEGRFPDLNGKLIMSGHGAFDDGSGSEKYSPLVMYEIGDDYVPRSNSCVGEIGTIDPNKNPPSFNIMGCYNKGDRFTVVEPTYSEYIKYDAKRIKCWFVHVRSKKTGKIYRALSR